MIFEFKRDERRQSIGGSVEEGTGPLCAMLHACMCVYVYMAVTYLIPQLGLLPRDVVLVEHYPDACHTRVRVGLSLGGVGRRVRR